MGIDSSSTMVNIVKEKIKKKSINASIFQCDAATYHSERSFDAVLCLFGVVDYFMGENCELLFSNISHAMKKDGLLIIDFMDLDFFREYGTKSTVLEEHKGNLKSVRVTVPELDFENKRFSLNLTCVIYKNRDLVDFFEETHILRIFDRD